MEKIIFDLFKKYRAIIIFALVIFEILIPAHLYSQTYKKRTYANFQGVYRSGLYVLGAESVIGTITNASLAADNSPQTASTLEIPLALAGTATVTQFLEFTTSGSHSTVRTIGAGTPVAVKFKIPSSILGLLDGIEIGTYTGLQSVSESISGFLGTGGGNAAGYNATNRNPIYSGNTLLNALNGAGELELILTPAQAYNGVYVKLSGNGLSLALTSQLFHAYILEDATIDCSTMNEAIDVLSGVKGNSLVNAASATGSVTLPWNAVDNDPSFTTYSTLSTGAQLLSNVFETVIFETPSQSGDSVKLVIQDPGGGLLNLVALKGFAIQPYLGNTAVGSPITNTNSLLSLKLLSGASNKYELTVAIPSSFDRIEILMGGVADAFSALRVYDVERVIAAPTITSNNVNVTNDTVFVYYSNSLELDAATLSSSDNIKWYNDENAQVGSGSSYFIPSVVEEGWYYAEAERSGCTETSSRHAVYVKILTPQMLNTQAERNRLRREIQDQAKVISIQNPVMEAIRVQLWGMEKGNYRMDMITLDGRLIYSKQITVSADRYSESIPRPANMNTGLYIVSIYDKWNMRIQTFKAIFK